MEVGLGEATINCYSKKDLETMVEHLVNWDYIHYIDIDHYIPIIYGNLHPRVHISEELYNNPIEKKKYIDGEKEKLIKKYMKFINDMKDKYERNMKLIRYLNQDLRLGCELNTSDLRKSKLKALAYENKRIQFILKNNPL